MNKRIIISESEKQRILSQHKNLVQNESELKKQSLSEREISKLINGILLSESNGPCKSTSDCKSPQKCINGKCETTTLSKEMKEASGCQSAKDCKSPQKCINGKCEITTTSLKETGEMDEGKNCPPGQQPCGGGCCPKGSVCRLGMCQSGISQPTPPVFKESELDEETNKTDMGEGK